MLTQGDVIEVDLGVPAGPEAGMRRPAVVVTAERILSGRPNVIQVVPLTTTIRESGTEIALEQTSTTVCACRRQPSASTFDQSPPSA